MFALWKGILSFENLFFVSIHNVEQIQTFLSDNNDKGYWQLFECNSVYTLHWLTLAGR